jgi:hypothetical protein
MSGLDQSGEDSLGAKVRITLDGPQISSEAVGELFARDPKGWEDDCGNRQQFSANLAAGCLDELGKEH